MDRGIPASIKKPSKDAVAVFGGSFNPPGLHHLKLAEALLQQFQTVVVVPCGLRSDKAQTPADRVSDTVRSQMVSATFAPLVDKGCIIDTRDLVSGVFTPTVDLAKVYQNRGELWFVIGADLFSHEADGSSEIQRSWKEGTWIWENLNFVCVTRTGFLSKTTDFPPRSYIIEQNINGSSSQIRRILREGGSVAKLVSPQVNEILKKTNAYR